MECAWKEEKELLQGELVQVLLLLLLYYSQA